MCDASSSYDLYGWISVTFSSSSGIVGCYVYTCRYDLRYSIDGCIYNNIYLPMIFMHIGHSNGGTIPPWLTSLLVVQLYYQCKFIGVKRALSTFLVMLVMLVIALHANLERTGGFPLVIPLLQGASPYSSFSENRCTCYLWTVNIRGRAFKRKDVGVGLSGLEPETSALSVPRSNQLSYSPVRDRLSRVEHNAVNLVYG